MQVGNQTGSSPLGSLETIDRQSVPELIVSEMLRRIRSGEWAPGQRLPPQRELARLLGVSLSSVREATRALGVMGFLETTRGQGTFVRHCDGNWIVPGDIAGVYFDRPETLREFIEARAALEEILAGLAAVKRHDEDVKVLKQIRKGMQASIDDLDTYRMLDGALHFRIADMAGNSILQQVFKGLHDLVEEYIRAVPDPTAGYEWHARLVDAIENRDSEGARLAMRRSLEVSDRLLEAIETRVTAKRNPVRRS